MSIRAALLKTMLVAIALSAIIAIAAIFLQSSSSWRLLATSVVVTFASATMLPAISNERGTRLDALAWTWVSYVGVAALLVISLVWADGFFIGGPFEEATWNWFLTGIPALGIAIPALKRRRRADRSLSLAESIAIFGASGVFAASMLIALPNRFGFGAFAVTIIFLPIVACAACAAIGLRTIAARTFDAPTAATRAERIVAQLGLGSASFAAIAGVLLLVEQHRSGLLIRQISWEPYTLAITLCGGVASAAASNNLLGLSRASGIFRWLRHVASAALIALSIVISAAVLMPDSGRFLEQLVWSLVIVAGSSLLAGLVAMRVTRAKPIGVGAIDRVSWRCPRCETTATIPLGDHACARCGLAVVLSLRDDRCPSCAYDLRALPASTKCCPECGRQRQLPSDLGRFLEQRETLMPVDRSSV